MVTLRDEWVEGARDGNLAAMTRIKEALAGLPVEEAFAQFQGALEQYRGQRLRPTRAVSLQARASSQAKHYLETAPSGIPFINAAPQVIGEGNPAHLVWKTRAAFVACFENARVWGRSSLIEARGEVLMDFEDWEFAEVDDRLEHDPRIFRSERDEIWYVDDGGREPDIVIDRAFVLLGRRANAFGHWMWECLPKFAAALNASSIPEAAVLIDDLQPAPVEALERMLPPGWSIVKVGVNAKVGARELWCAPSLSYMPLMETPSDTYNWNCVASPPDRFRAAIETMQAAFRAGSEPVGGGRKVFLSRHRLMRRQLTNRDEIEDLCRKAGFEIVIPESLGFAQQVALIRSADHIVGPDGSALYLAFFARPGTRLCILSHPDVEGQATFTAVVEALGVRPVVFTGPFARRHPKWSWFSDYSIDARRFDRFLREWIGAAPSRPSSRAVSDAVKVFCIGLNKTGTTSLERALRDLGYRMGNQSKGELLIKDWLRRDFDAILDFADSAEAFQDIPFSLPFTFVHLAEKYPSGKFILSVRDSAQQWYESIVRNAMAMTDPPRIPDIRDMKADPYRYEGWHYDSHCEVIPNSIPDPFDRKTLSIFYGYHNYAVRSFFRHDPRLLVINVAQPDSYRKMCKFLGKAPLLDRFPHLNKSPDYALPSNMTD